MLLDAAIWVAATGSHNPVGTASFRHGMGFFLKEPNGKIGPLPGEHPGFSFTFYDLSSLLFEGFRLFSPDTLSSFYGALKKKVYVAETAFLQLYQEYFANLSLWYIMITVMVYARATGSNSGFKFQEKYYNDKLVVCMDNGFTYEHLGDSLHNHGFLKYVSGFQKVDFNRRFALVIEDAALRDLLVESGLNIDGKHVAFAFHKKRDLKRRVYISQLPIGITHLELKEVFSFYGDIMDITFLSKIIHERKIDSGDRVIIFKELKKETPSYVYVRGWRAYVKYNGQPQTCRVCDLTGHFAKDCPASRKPNHPESDASARGTQPGNKKSSEKPPENKGMPIETQPSKPVITQAEIMDTPCTRESSQKEFHILEPDPEILQSCSDGIFCSISMDADDDIQSVDSLEDEEEELPAQKFHNFACERFNPSH